MNLDPLLSEGRSLSPAPDGTATALAQPSDSSYDRTARAYDKLIPNRVYSRLAWGTRPAEYVAFAREAVASGSGPLLDVAGGTGVFTADVYAASRRPIVFCDLSAAMLARARKRIDGDHVTFVQADATDPPFAPGAFETVACLSATHVFSDPGAVVRAIWPLVAPGGSLFASGFVTSRAVSTAYMKLLQRAGEVGPLHSEAELTALVEAATGAKVETRRAGAMGYITAVRAVT